MLTGAGSTRAPPKAVAEARIANDTMVSGLETILSRSIIADRDGGFLGTLSFFCRRAFLECHLDFPLTPE